MATFLTNLEVGCAKLLAGESARTSFGSGLREDGAKRVEAEAAAEEEEWWRERVWGARDKKLREAAIASNCV